MALPKSAHQPSPSLIPLPSKKFDPRSLSAEMTGPKTERISQLGDELRRLQENISTEEVEIQKKLERYNATNRLRVEAMRAGVQTDELTQQAKQILQEVGMLQEKKRSLQTVTQSLQQEMERLKGF